ncbi:MAG: ATP-binding cassette subfamily B multidrug efflux pump [Myxococcota bacterium]
MRLYALRYKAWYGWGLLALLATNSLSVAIPAYLENAMSSVDPVLGDGKVDHWVAMIFGAAVGLIVVRTASRMLIFVPGREAEAAIRYDYFRHLMRLQPPFYRRMQLGDLLSRGSNDIQFVRVLVGFAGLQVLNLAFSLPLNLFMMSQISGWLTFGCVLPMLASLWVMRYGVRAMMVHMLAAQEDLSALSGEVLESYNGVRVVESYGARDAMLKRFDARNITYVDHLVSIAFVRSFLLPFVRVIGNVGVLILLYVGGTMVAEEKLHFGAVSAFSVYLTNIVGSLTALGWVINIIQRGQISLRRILEVLQTSPELPPVTAELPKGPLDLELRDLTFAYAGDDTDPVLSNISITVPAGTTLGLFGATGSGKTTLLRLLARLEDGPPGSLLVGGVDLRSVPLGDLRDAMAVVTQRPYLFSRSLRENVAFGGGEAPVGTGSDSAVMQALDRAALAGDLDALPDGLDTVVGERGVTLSGGQRQRAALARAFYRPSRILLLDDTLSAVDTDTEQQLIEAIYDVEVPRTTVMVSHRVSALKHAEQIVVLAEGRVLQRGTHTELLARGGPYADAWSEEEDAE